jgi:AraC-like DNA-binding protein
VTHTIFTPFQSANITVTDFRCDGCDAARSSEECAFGHELSITRSGSWLRRNSQGRQLGDPTRVIFFNEGAYYDVEHPVGGGDHCTAIAYSPAAIDDVASDLGIALDPEASPFSAPSAPASAELQLLVRQLDARLSSNRERTLACEEICLQILAKALRAATPERGSPRRADSARSARHRALAHDALIELARRFREPLLLGDLARALDCSPFHLARIFKEQTGESIHRRVMHLRLSAALEEIAASRQQIGSIAHELGFCDHAHLCAAFARHYGISPSKLRLSLQDEP